MTHHPKCSCVKYCGDVPEDEDNPYAVCKNLRPEPRPPLVKFVLVHKSELER